MRARRRADDREPAAVARGRVSVGIERGRATAPRASVPPFEAATRYAGPRAGMVFTTRGSATGYYRDAAVPVRLFCASTLPDVLFWKVLSFWRTSRDDDDYVATG